MLFGALQGQRFFEILLLGGECTHDLPAELSFFDPSLPSPNQSQISWGTVTINPDILR